jgi:outer membrane protein assembly factor BamC
LEAEFLSRLMISLGTPGGQAKPAVAASTGAATPAAAAEPVAKARALAGAAGAALTVDDTTERAWRRVGLALDRSGFTVEDRDRAQMLYFVRYADPKSAGHEEPGFFTRLFSSKEAIAKLSRYRIAVKASGAQTVVSVLNDQGAPDNSANAQQIVKLLVDELKY